MNKGKGTSATQKRRRYGFSIAELLAVIAILGILAGFVGVTAVNMYKNMKQTQLDKTAETVFHAVQDRLSELYAYGKEGTIEDGILVDTIADASKKKVLYITSDDIDKNAFKAIMGDDTVSADIIDNLWAIEYQASTCRVLNVVYADKSGNRGLGGFGGGLNTEATLSEMVTALKNHSFTGRMSKFGWYGDAALTDLQDGNKQVGDTSVDVEIINEENLYAHIRVSVGWEDDLTASEISSFLEGIKLTLTLKDADDTSLSAAQKSFEIPAKNLLSKGTINSDANGYYNGRSDADTGSGVDYVSNKYLTASWDMLLDSLSANAFTGSNSVKTIDGYGTGITPGSNFYLIAKLESDDGITPAVQDYDVDNSLFAAYSPSTGKAYIEYGRHLQNAGKSEIANLAAVQIADLDFNSEASFGRDDKFDEFNKYWLSVYPDVSGYTNYQPYSSAYLSSYDGQNHIIRNLDINKAATGSTYAGIFGDLSVINSVKNVIITDSKVNASGASAAGMFAAKISGTSALTVEKCYLGKVLVDGSSSASLGGFAGDISSPTVAGNCAFMDVKAGTSVAGTNSGTFAGRVTGSFDGNKLYAFGGKAAASSNAGGLIGYVNAPLLNLTLNGCKISGTEVSSSSGNAGGIAGYVQNQTGTISIGSDTVVAGCVVKSNTGNAGGFIGSTDSAMNISDSAYYMPGSSESAQTAGKISSEFAKAMGMSASAGEVTVTYANLKDLVGFKYVNELKTAGLSGMQWISGSGNAGGLVGVSTKDMTVTNTFATGVLSASNGNAGGFIGNTTGKLSVTGSYADFYISGKKVGGFAAGCGSNSTFASCYTAGFLCGNADSAAGFAPVAVGSITNSYTVFNFDNVTDTTLFAGTAEEDDDHKLNENGTVTNYPNVETHSFYPVALSNSGKAYYVYSETNFEETDNAVCVKASELAENKTEDGATIVSGSFVKGLGKNNTVPYLLSSFFGTTLKDYPFPALRVNKTVDGATVETVLKHYNDWLIIDKNSMYDIEVWYMLYDENLKTLKTDVARIGKTGIKKLRDTKAIPVKKGNDTEYQINVGSREEFSGYKFVGYFDPTSATLPLLSSSSFNRGLKCDYLTSQDSELSPSIKKQLGSGDRVVQTSITAENTYGYQCSDHSKILEENESNVYAATKRIYAVYRYNKPYNVVLSYREYPLPKTSTEGVPESFEKIYHDSKVATDDIFEVTYTESPDVYKLIYAEKPAIKEKVAAAHNKRASDEEITEDYIAEQVLRSYYPSDATYKEKLSKLDDIRAGKQTQIDSSTTIPAKSINQKNRKVPNLTSGGFDLLNFDELVNKNIITSTYARNAKNKPVYTIVRIGPAKDSDGSQIAFNNRGFTEVKKDNNNYITMSTHKEFEYVILYYPDSVNRKLNFVFRNSDWNGTNPEVDSYANLSDSLENRPYKASGEYTVHAGYKGFSEIPGGITKLINSPPTFAGFTLDEAASDSSFPSDGNEATLVYNRNKYALSFRLKDDERYENSSSREPIQDIYYGDLYQQYLWESYTTDVDVTIDGPHRSELENAHNIEVGHWEKEWYFNNIFDWGQRDVWKVEYTATDYNALKQYVAGQTDTTGTFELRFGNRDENYTWKRKEGDLSYKFNRKGYLLTGFKIYYEDDSGNYNYQETTNSISKALYMPDRNVLVEPVWIINPGYLRVEIYYQSAYDDISAEGREKKYEYYGAATYPVTNGEAAQVTRRVGNRNETLTITDLVMSEDDKTFATYLDSFLRAGNFNKRKEHNPSEDYPYVLNEDNTLRLGYHHFITNDADKDTIAVALYYDRSAVEYTFHFINAGNNEYSSYQGRYYTSRNNYALFNIRNQWRDFTINSPLYTYTGDDTYKNALKNELTNKTGKYVKVSKYAEVKCTTENDTAVDNTTIIYGGFYGNTYLYSNTTNTTNNTVRYQVAVTYKALYGAPAIFDDGSSLVPTWYCYMGANGTNRKDLQRYIIGGSSSGTTTYYNDFSLKYFGEISSETTSQTKDLYPYYPESDAGNTYFYTEIAKYDDPGFSPVRAGTNESVTNSHFKNTATLTSFGKSGNTVFINNEGVRIFIDGYTTYKVVLDNGTTYYENNLPQSAGSNSTNLRIYLKRNTFSIQFVDAELNTTDFNTSYLYKQAITRLPKDSELKSPSSEYTFDGWYTNSNYDTKIAGRDGEILDSYKVAPQLVYDGKLLMNYENMQVFAKWAPNQCRVVFNPFFPDIKDDNLNISLGTVDYGTPITEFPTIVSPAASGYDNRFLDTVDGDLYYTIKNNKGQIVRKYKFDGWYKYTGHNENPDMDDLVVKFNLNDKITDHTTLYAKWIQTDPGMAMYTVTCLDYEKNEVILSVLRSGNAGQTVTINPPAYTDADNPDDIDIISGSYEALKKYEALTSPIETNLKDGDTHKFRYKSAASWEYTVKCCVTVVDGEGNPVDIVLSSETDPTSFAQKLIAAPDIDGYSIYEYQIGDNAAVPKTELSDYITLERPGIDSEGLVVTIRYYLNEDSISAKENAVYNRYDAIDWAVYDEETFDWQDSDYAPAILYTVGGVTTYEFIGNAANEASSAKAAKDISDGIAGSGPHDVQMKLIAVKGNTNTLEYLVVKAIGTTNVTINDSAYALTFRKGDALGSIYYAYDGSNAGKWCWDKELRYVIGPDGTSIANATIGDELPTSAATVQNIIKSTYNDQTDLYKSFVILKDMTTPTSGKAYTVVDRFGKLCNGALLTTDTDAYMEGEADDEDTFEITLYDTDGEEIGKIYITLP